MCCLKYEQDAYEDLIKHSPKQESFVDTPDGRGTVKEVNLLRQSVKVSMEKQPDTIGCYKNDEICVLRNGKARKNDPPIPDDLAPISGNSVKRRNPDEEESFPVLEDVVIKTALPDRARSTAGGAEKAPQPQPRQAQRAIQGWRRPQAAGQGAPSIQRQAVRPPAGQPAAAGKARAHRGGRCSCQQAPSPPQAPQTPPQRRRTQGE